MPKRVLVGALVELIPLLGTIVLIIWFLSPDGASSPSGLVQLCLLSAWVSGLGWLVKGSWLGCTFMYLIRGASGVLFVVALAASLPECWFDCVDSESNDFDGVVWVALTFAVWSVLPVLSSMTLLLTIANDRAREDRKN